MLLAILTLPAQAQTYAVLHSFVGTSDGANPYAGVTIDRAGNLFGTATCYDRQPCTGTVFEMKPTAGGGWIIEPLYAFSGGDDGAYPFGRVILAPDGTLYGNTEFGGGGPCNIVGFPGCGTIFHLTPPPTVCTTVSCPWTETIVYRFQGRDDGAFPVGNLIFDQAGNIYGTAEAGGANNKGVVFKLTHSGENWTQSTLYSFTGGADGADPVGGVIFDNGGNLDGTTSAGGTNSFGAVYQLSPSGGGWTEHTLYDFLGGSDGAYSYAGLIIDRAGNLYGTTAFGGGASNAGTVFELSPSGGSWSESVLHAFNRADGFQPSNSLVMDSAGHLYGTTYTDSGTHDGNVFKLTHSGGSWDASVVHQFVGADGANPYSFLTLDARGNLYGTTFFGGIHGYGVVFEITP